MALSDATESHGEVTLTIAGAPADWVVDGATHNADGSWTVTTTDGGSLTVTTPVNYVGAHVLTVARDLDQR